MTGDLAAKGRADEYAEVQRWIDQGLRKALPKGFRRDRILMVPGNHDVDRDAVNRMVESTQDSLIKEQDQEAVKEVLSDPPQRDMLLGRHQAYLNFANNYQPKHSPRAVPWWSQNLRLQGRTIHFVGLCSSWMSCGDQDHGRLLVGRWQAHELLNGAGEADFRVVLMHHPWSYFAEFDSREVEPLIHREADLVLRGHLHQEQGMLKQDFDHVHLELAAGCVYENSRYSNGFQLIEIFPSSRRVRVHYRTWYKGQWIPDRNAYQAAQDGVAEIAICIAARTESAAATEPVVCDTRRYLRFLRDRNSHIDIRGLTVTSGRAPKFSIEELYIPLTTTLTDREGKPGEQDLDRLAHGRAEPVALHEALQHSRLVIVGDPGSGKTTFLRRIAWLLSRSLLGEDAGGGAARLGLHPQPTPVLIRVADLAGHIAAARSRGDGHPHETAPVWLAHYLATFCEGASLGVSEQYFLDQLQHGGLIVLIDGLDEAASLEARQQISQLIEQAAAAYAPCRFVVTSRPGAYRGQVVLHGFQEVQINPLEDEAIRVFLTRWCEALFARQTASCSEHLGELLDALKTRPEIRRIARNPVMLTALAVVHWNEKRLPEQRADLYESIIGWLSRAREKRDGRPVAERCVGLLQNLALAMHDHPEGRKIQLPRYTAAGLLAPSLRGLPEPEQRPAAERFLADEEVDSGIVIGRGKELRFWHLTFQEYLAARALAALSDEEQRSRLLHTPKLFAPEWRETVLLLAGVLADKAFECVDRLIATVLDRIDADPAPSERARVVGLLGAVIRDLSPLKYQVSDVRYRQALDEVMAIFDPDRCGSVPIHEAIEAAEALGAAGDPRFTPEARRQNWIEIPAGEFWMGAQKDDPAGKNYDADAGSLAPEGPVHRVQLDAFRIAKYPVTVGEYAEFIAADGYTEEKHWTAGGFDKFKEPDKWEEQLQHPTRPVINASWYEASAYAAWRNCRLPTEAEWERAARGVEYRRYPWGDEEPDERRMNYEFGVGSPTPVGIYPLGDTPEGACDMAGNVWEWCADGYDEYPREPQQNPRRAGSSRVLRGGGWRSDASRCRCACRVGRGPVLRGSGIGFRLLGGA